MRAIESLSHDLIFTWRISRVLHHVGSARSLGMYIVMVARSSVGLITMACDG